MAESVTRRANGEGSISRRRDGAVVEINSEAGADVGNDAMSGDAPYFSPEGGTESDGAYVYTKDQMDDYDSWGKVWDDVESRTLD